MMLPIEVIKTVLQHFGVPLVPVELKKRLTRAVPGIAAKMEKNGVTPATAAAKVVVREALFLLWRSVIPSGTVADIVRDIQDDKVVALVGPLPAGTTPEAAVTATLDALIQVMF